VLKTSILKPFLTPLLTGSLARLLRARLLHSMARLGNRGVGV
jgi:hypothetical protein